MSTSPSTNMTSSKYNQPQSSRPACRDFSWGQGRRGTACKFLHDEATLQVSHRRTSGTPNDSTGMGRTYTCEKAGAVVTYGDGAMVTRLSLPSDFSAVRVTGIANTATPRDVARLLSRISRGPVYESNFTRLWEAPGKTEKAAEVQVENTRFAGLLQRQEAAELGIKLTPISSRLHVPGSLSSRRFDCRKVVCSWERPTRGIRLYYDNEDTARQVYEKFDSGYFTILGDCVKAYAPVEVRDVTAQCPFNWRVQLEGVVGTDQAQVQEIVHQVPKHLQPRQILLGQYTYNVSENFASEAIQFLLQPFGLLEQWEICQTSKAKTMVGTAWFRHEAAARDAARALRDTELPFNNQLRLSVQLVNEAHFKIPARLFDTVRGQIDQHKRDWATAGVTLAVYPPTIGNLRPRDLNLRLRDLKLEGEDSSAFAKHTNNCRRSWLDEWLVERTHPVLVHIDGQKRQFRILGPDEAHEPAEQMLLSLLKAYYGERTPAKPQDTAAVPEAGDCTVCWTEPEAWERIHTSCGHTYCQGCFAHLAHSTGRSTTKEFEISCAAEGCETVFPLEEIQRYVSAEAFEQILDASLASYIARGAAYGEIIKYCPTPDCGNIFRSTATLTTEPGRDMLTCQKCLHPVRTNCHVAHGEMSCAKYQPTKDGGAAALEAVKKELGVKDCPKCGMFIERDGGCNHVVCERGCGAHICWVCLGTFGTGAQCYTHMLDVHRRIWEPEDAPVPGEE